MVAAALAGGVDWIQVRERGRSAGSLLELVDEIQKRAIRAGHPLRTLVNRRVDVAWTAAAQGAHLGFDGMSAGEAKKILGESAIVGISTHSVDEIARAEASGADYVQLAPIFPPLSKAAGRPALGLATLRRACRSALPVLAQGGIRPENARDVIEAGAAGIAVTGAIGGAEDPEAAARALRRALDAALRRTDDSAEEA